MTSGAAAGDGLFRSVFEGCISGSDIGIERRPYHRNCECALHKSRGKCTHANPSGKKVTYPMRRSWSEGCLALAASTTAVYSGASSPSSSPAVTGTGLGLRRSSQLSLCIEEYEDDGDNDCFSFKV